MLKECLEVFKSELDEKGEEWLLDNYTPKDGTYILINIDDSFSSLDPIEIKTDKKTRDVQGKTDLNYKFITFLDYYSKLVEMNKPIDSSKIIHSNNYYSFFVKKESILQKKITDSNVESYYSILSNPIEKYKKSKKATAIYEQTLKEVGNIDVEKIEMIRNWINLNFYDFVEQKNIDITKKDYLKLFFICDSREKTKELVKNEGMRYLIPNIYNSNDFNCEVGNIVYGLPSNNMGMNAKKPYLGNKTRKEVVPYLIDKEEALLQCKFFDYLAGQATLGRFNIYVDFDEMLIKSYTNKERIDYIESGIYLRIQPDKELKIDNMDHITGYQAHLKTPFSLRNIASVSIDKVDPGYGRKTNLFEIESLVDDIFFSKQLNYNYFTKPEDISITDGTLKNILLIYRENLWNWFYKGDSQFICNVMNQMVLRIIINTLKNQYFFKAQHQLNLWISIVDYLHNNRRMEEQMGKIREQLKNHIDEKGEWEFEGPAEYYYAVGQMLRVFLKKSNATRKSEAIINPILNAQNDHMIKQRLGNLFKKYNFSFEDRDFRINNLIGHIMEYQTSNAIDKDMVIAGFTMGNLVFTAKEKKIVVEENGENE